MPSPLLRRALLSALLVLGPGLRPALGQQEPPRPNQQAFWYGLIERDARVSFTRLTVPAALEVLARTGQAEEVRASALMALGCSGDPTQRERLEGWLESEAFVERQAAVLGLGELGFAENPIVLSLATGRSPQLAGCAQLALLRSRSPQGRTVVRAVADDASHPLQPLARDLLGFVESPSTSNETIPGRRLMMLRWDAARRFGLIDNLSWTVRLEQELCNDESFLDQVIFNCASELRRAGVADHFLEILLAPGRPERLRGVVNAMPTELDQLVATGLWAPADAAEWAQIVFAIDERRLEGLTDTLLRSARVIPDLSAYGSALLVRGGNPDGMPLLELDLGSPQTEVRARIAETMGGSGEERLIQLLNPLLTDAEPAVRTSALIAHMRLGDPAAEDDLRAALADTMRDDHTELVERLCRVVNDPRIRALMGEYINLFPPPQKLSATVALARVGESVDREPLRAALRGLPAGAPVRTDVIAALALFPSIEDLALLRELYPRENDFAVNLELASAFVRLKDPLCQPLLRSALWREPWNRGVLAGALIIEVGGIDALRSELQRPPQRVSNRDLRRVGFALGEWGGLPEVENLARLRSSGDPVVQGALLGALGARTHE